MYHTISLFNKPTKKRITNLSTKSQRRLFIGVFGTEPEVTSPTATCSCRSFRSASCRNLNIPQYRRSTFCTQTFSVAGPTVWNSLPDWLRNPSVESERFRRDDIRDMRALQVSQFHGIGLTYILIYFRTYTDEGLPKQR